MTTTRKRRPSVPAGLDERGQRLWRQVVAAYELGHAELVVLAEACRTADLVARLDKQLVGEELTATGSRGQPALNPLVAEVRMQRDLLGRLIARLALPDDPMDTSTAASRLGSRGAMARHYGKQRGT